MALELKRSKLLFEEVGGISYVPAPGMLFTVVETESLSLHIYQDQSGPSDRLLYDDYWD